MHLIVTWISIKEGIHMLAVFKMLLFVSVSYEIEKNTGWVLLLLLLVVVVFVVVAVFLICEKFCE